jgi:predicted transcriptional regulator
LTAIELARRVGSDPETVSRELEDLAELGYLTLEGAGAEERRASLTAEGMDLVNVTEDALLAAAGREAEVDESTRAPATRP